MRSKIGKICIGLGTVLLLVALSLFAFTKWEDWNAGQTVASVAEQLEILVEHRQNEQSISAVGGTGSTSVSSGSSGSTTMDTVEVDGYDYIGTLSISRFGLQLPVMDSWSYPALRIAPCRQSGSVWNNNLVICAHNYERHFGNLKYLEAGDVITFTDVNGNVFSYVVVEVNTFAPTQVDDILHSGYDLTLYTCTIGGKTRVVVYCSLVG